MKTRLLTVSFPAVLAATCVLLTMPAHAQTQHAWEVLGCLLEPTTTSDLSSSSRGKIEELRVARGDIVKTGDVMAKLESGVEELNVEIAKTRAAMNMDLDAKQAKFELSMRTEQRTRDLAANNMVSSMTLDEAVTQTTIARMEALQAQEQQVLATVELKRTEELLDQRFVRSTLDGVVVELYKEVGEFIDEDPILKLAALDPIKVEVIAPVSMFGKFSEGMTFTVVPELAGFGPYQADVVVVDKIIDAGSGTFRVTLLLPNPDYAIPAGLNCQLVTGN